MKKLTNVKVRNELLPYLKATVYEDGYDSYKVTLERNFNKLSSSDKKKIDKMAQLMIDYYYYLYGKYPQEKDFGKPIYKHHAKKLLGGYEFKIQK